MHIGIIIIFILWSIYIDSSTAYFHHLLFHLICFKYHRQLFSQYTLQALKFKVHQMLSIDSIDLSDLNNHSFIFIVFYFHFFSFSSFDFQ